MNYERMFRVKVIESLHELSDEAFQRRVWLASSGPEISSFDEAISGLFDDTGLDSILDAPERPPVFSTEVYDGLRQLRNLVDKASQAFHALPPSMRIDDPRMRDIRASAATILALIRMESHNV
jgi:hypothetical protein